MQRRVFIIMFLSMVCSIPGKPPVVADFPELKEVLSPLSSIGIDRQPAARVLAFEENPHFMYALTGAIGSHRRILFVKPSVYVLDESAKSAKPLSFPDPAWSREILLEKGERLLQVLQPPRTGNDTQPFKVVLDSGSEGISRVSITTSKGVVKLELPPPGAGAGWVAVETPDGKSVSPRRPLPSGILPHGPEGMRLIERWDRAYRDGRTPPWDTGLVAGDLEKVVEDKIIRPGRTVILGCGSGDNAIYLAKQGFDVTAIDVAPTALALAEAKAQKAGVKVHWMLADVLALPDLEPFDFMFDRGCYHNIRYVDAKATMAAINLLSKPGTQFLVLSLDRAGPPGVREEHMRGDFSGDFEFVWLNNSQIRTHEGGTNKRPSWALMLRKK